MPFCCCLRTSAHTVRTSISRVQKYILKIEITSNIFSCLGGVRASSSPPERGHPGVGEGGGGEEGEEGHAGGGGGEEAGGASQTAL